MAAIVVRNTIIRDACSLKIHNPKNKPIVAYKNPCINKVPG